VVGLSEVAHVDAEPLEVQSGVVRGDLAHQKRVEGSRPSYDRHEFVAPLVTPGWTARDPVNVWLACKPSESDASLARALCLEAFAGRLVGRKDTDFFAETIAAAERARGLRSTPGVVALRVADSASGEAWKTVGLSCLFMLIASYGLTDLSARRRRLARATASG
jgi:hypothetical protein